MSINSGIAKASANALTWVLKNIAHRPAGNLPGKVAAKIDPSIISELRWKLRDGSIVVVGTNGKTTVTNLLADTIEASGKTVLCNRTGANLKSGIASALIQGHPCDWGIIECDELWMAKVLPDLRPTYVLLLNLFRDQLDRCGEIDRIQDAIVSALENSPGTTLLYNADDPLCEFIAKRVSEKTATISFGINENMRLVQNKVSDATMCQNCSHMFEYEYRQYGQLGSYSCPNCGFHRPELVYSATDIHFTNKGLSLKVSDNVNGELCELRSDLAGSYMAYNLLAVYCASHLAGVPNEDIQRAIDCFNPNNGRLQNYFIDGHKVLLNLAKNPTGFNQNLRIVCNDKSPKAVAFFINDEVVDGHDISWIWDIDFEELYPQGDTLVFAGGKRRNDLQVRLKYAGIKAVLIHDISDVFKILASDSDVASLLPSNASVYAIANYSALPPVKHSLDTMAKSEKPIRDKYHLGDDLKSHSEKANSAQITGREPSVSDNTAASSKASADQTSTSNDTNTPIVIAHILPDLLNLYGDGGNVRILEKRLEWRGIPVEVRKIQYGDEIRFNDVDLVFLGGGPDREQKLATEELFKVAPEFKKYIESEGPLLSICGGFQILGRTWLLGDEEVEGLDIIDAETRRPGTSADRLVDNIALRSELAEMPVIGYENHAGRTYLGKNMAAFGNVISHTGVGNSEDASNGQRSDGVLDGNIIGTYLHGCLLSKNPEVADWLLSKAIERHSSRTGESEFALTPIDDSEEIAANSFMAKKII